MHFITLNDATGDPIHIASDRIVGIREPFVGAKQVDLILAHGERLTVNHTAGVVMHAMGAKYALGLPDEAPAATE